MRKHAALGGISLALKLGEAIIAAEAKGGSAVIDAIAKTTGGAILAEGKITDKSVVYTKEAFDIGTLTLGQGDKAIDAACHERIYGGRGRRRHAAGDLPRRHHHADRRMASRSASGNCR